MRTLVKATLVLLVLGLSLHAAQRMEPGLDYFVDAGGAIDSLVRGDLTGFFADQPLMGSFSLLLRAPFVALVFDQSEAVVYLAGAVPCVLATVVLGLALSRLLADRGHGSFVQGVAAGLCVLNPITFKALHWGHPEELLAASLSVGAVLAAVRERDLLAAVLLGLAVATKQWAVIAILPTLLAAPRHRMRLGAVAAGVAGALTLPLLIGNPDQFLSVGEAAGGGHPGVAAGSARPHVTPWNVWWPFTDSVQVAGRGETSLGPEWLGRISHPLIVLLPIPLSLLLWRRRGRRPDDALLLLALLFLLRNLLDSSNNDYYHAPFLLSLIAWETVRYARLPYLSLTVSGLLAVSFWPHLVNFWQIAPHATWMNALYLAWALPLLAYLGLELYVPQRLRALAPSPRAVAAHS